jgi:AAA domain (dynein-related subfamily)
VPRTAVKSALAAIDEVAAEGDIAAEAEPLPTLDAPADKLTLPDGRVLYPPRLFGSPLHEVACELMDLDDPVNSRFLRLIGPPGTGKSQIARAIAHEMWRRRGLEVITRHGAPFYGLIELQPGPSSDEFFFRYDYVPDPDDAARIKLVEAAFVEAMRNGWLVVIDEANAARDIALLSINATLDGRLTLYLPATGETVLAQPGFGVILTYNPGLVGASDIPNAWYSRFPATIEISSNWPALVALGVDRGLVGAAAKYDEQRKNGELAWSPQFREVESLHVMCERVGQRTAVAMFVSSLCEQVETGQLQHEDAVSACRMLDEGGFAVCRLAARSKVPSFEGYPRAVTS